MEPEEIAPFLLDYLIEQENTNSSQLNRYNLTLSDNIERNYDKNYIHDVAKVLTEAWVWLEKEGFIAPKPDTLGEWVFITRKGKKLSNSTNFLINLIMHITKELSE